MYRPAAGHPSPLSIIDLCPPRPPRKDIKICLLLKIKFCRLLLPFCPPPPAAHVPYTQHGMHMCAHVCNGDTKQCANTHVV